MAGSNEAYMQAVDIALQDELGPKRVKSYGDKLMLWLRPGSQDGIVEIDHIVATSMRQGFGSKAMRILTELATAHNVTLALRVADETDNEGDYDPEDPECPPTKWDLIRWYRSFGFEVIKDDDRIFMRRFPGPEMKAAHGRFFGLDTSRWTAGEWHASEDDLSDILIVALSRLYGLQMAAEFELHADGSTGALLDLFCLLPDGNALSIFGPYPCPKDNPNHRDPDDPSVVGTCVVHTHEHDERLLQCVNSTYAVDVDDLGAVAWVEQHVGPQCRNLGLAPIEKPNGAIEDSDQELIPAMGVGCRI